MLALSTSPFRPSFLPAPLLLFRGKPPEIAASPSESSDDSGLTPKTGLHDFFISRTRHKAQHNGVAKMDIVPLNDKSDWFRIDADYTAMIAQKKALLKQYPDIVTATLPEGEAGARELLEMMAVYLPKHFPSRFKLEGRILENLTTQDRYDLDHLTADPIVVAGLLVQEDLVLLHQGADGKFTLTSGSVHFPSAWSLPEKLGEPLEAIHGPVTGLNENIGAAIQRFLEKLNPDKPFWRINFLSTTSPEMTHLPDVPELSNFRDGLETTNANVERLYLRNEREVFTRLPQTKDVLFSLKTYITALRDLPPVVARKLAEVIRALPDSFVKEYKGWADSEKEAILKYLERSPEPSRANSV